MSKIATREAYGNALAKLISEKKDVVVLDADLSGSTKTSSAKKVDPKRHFNVGIAESNMIGIAAGLATSNKIVYASTFAIFAAGRAFEQIRNSLCYPRLNVKVCATHAGLTVGEDGASHQAIEDIALMRSVPNMTVIQPVDDLETEAVINYIYSYPGPVYVRLGRSGVERVNPNSYKYEFGKGVILNKGEDVAIIATGMLVQESLKAREELLKKGIDPTIVNIHTLKPIDKDLIIELAKTHNRIITAEEHNIIGGLGSAVAEVLSTHYPKLIQMLGVQDTFGESGKPADLIKKYGIAAEDIVKLVLK